MVPNFSKCALSFVMEFSSRGIFLITRVSEGFCGCQPPPEEEEEGGGARGRGAKVVEVMATEEGGKDWRALTGGKLINDGGGGSPRPEGGGTQNEVLSFKKL